MHSSFEESETWYCICEPDEMFFTDWCRDVDSIPRLGSGMNLDVGTIVMLPLKTTLTHWFRNTRYSIGEKSGCANLLFMEANIGKGAIHKNCLLGFIIHECDFEKYTGDNNPAFKKLLNERFRKSGDFSLM